MFTTSFRILVGSIHGANIYINGSAPSFVPLRKGAMIRATSRTSPLSKIGELAQVIESVPTTRDRNTFNWRLSYELGN